MTKEKSMNVIARAKAPTTKFFRVLRTVGLALAAAGGTILAAPVSLPALAINIAGYATIVGGVMTAVSQTAVKSEPAEDEPEEQVN